MDRSAPVYYVAVRKPAELKKTSTTAENPPERPPKPKTSVRIQSEAIQVAVGPYATATQSIKDVRLRDTALKVIAQANEGAKSKSASKVKGARELLTQSMLYSQDLPFRSAESPLDVLGYIQAAAKLRAALRVSVSRGARRRGDQGGRNKPATPPVDVSDRVVSFKFEDNERKVDRVTLTVDNFDLSLFDDPLFKRGNIIEYTFGYASGLAPIREAVIRKVTGGRQLTIEAHSKDVIMDRIKRRETFKSTTRSDVVRLIADRNGYAEEQQSVEDTTELYDALVQPNLTDAQFLRKLANKQGFEFFVDYDGFHWHSRNLEQAPLRKLIYYTDPGEGDIVEWSVENDLTRRPARVRVRGINPTTGETIEAVEDDSTDTQRDVLQPTQVTEDIINIDGESGATQFDTRTVTQPVAHEQDETSVPVDDVGQAQVEAKRRYRKAQQRAVKMSITMVGDPTIVGKSVILVEGMGKRLSGRYYVQQADHTISGGGTYTLSLKLITDGFGSSRKRGSGGKGAQNAENLSLEAVLELLKQVSYGTSNSRIREAVDKALAGIRRNMNPSMDKGRAKASAAIALKLIGVVQALGKSATGPEKNAGKSIVHAAGAVAGVCKRIAAQDPEKEASGRVNDKPPQDESPVDTLRVDPVTGGVV